MRTLAWAYVRQAWFRSLLIVLGVAAGVGAMVAMEMGTHGALGSLKDVYREAAGPADLTLTSGGGEYAPLPGGTLARVEALDAVDLALPLVQVSAVRAEELDAWAGPLLKGAGGDQALTIFGVDYASEALAERWALADGADAGVMLDRDWARRRGLAIGDPLELMVGARPIRWTITGLLEPRGLAARAAGKVVIAPLEQVRRDFGLPADRLHEIVLKFEEGTDTEAIAVRLGEQLGSGVHISAPQERGQDVAQRLANITESTGLISTLVLCLAAFLIFGLFTTESTRRQSQLGLLRCVGATRSQAIRVFLLEAALLAVPGAAIGLLTGPLMAIGIAAAMSQVAGARLTVPALDPLEALVFGVIGVAVALLSALRPALAAVTASPRDAQRGLVGDAGAGFGGGRVVWMLTIVAAAALLFGPLGEVHQGVVFAVILLLLGGLVWSLPAWAPRVVDALHALAGPLARSPFTLGAAALRWRPIRTGLAAGAVLMSLALVGGVTGVTQGMRVEIEQWAERALGWDLFVWSSYGLDDAAVRRIEGAEGVVRSAKVSTLSVRVGLPSGETIYPTLVGVDAAAYAEQDMFVLTDPAAQPSAVLRALVDQPKALITSVLAGQYGLAPGDTLSLATPQGPLALEVAAVAVDYTENGFALFVDHALPRDRFQHDAAGLVALRLADGADAAAIATALQAELEVTVNDSSALRAEVMKLVDQGLQGLQLLVWLSVLIALLAVGTAIGQSAIERRRDIAALRSLGMSRRQVGRMILWEGALTAAYGAVPGVVAGIILARVFSHTLHGIGIFTPFVAPWAPLLVSGALAVLTGLAASWLPARRAATVEPAEALRAD